MNFTSLHLRFSSAVSTSCIFNERRLLKELQIVVMQIGFGYLEVGNVRSKNATSVMMKNMMDSCE